MQPFIAEKVTDLGRTEFGRPTLTAIVVGPVWRDLEAHNSFLRRLRTYHEATTEEERIHELLERIPTSDIVMAACESLNHQPDDREFGEKILSQALRWVDQQIAAKSGKATRS